MGESKVCSKCGIDKPITEYYMSQGKRRSYCKECGNKYHDKYVKNNKDKVNAKKRETYQKNIEHKRNIQRLYREKNREKVDSYNRKYYEEHREYFRNHAKEYRKNHFEKLKEYNKKWGEENKDHLKEVKRENNRKRMEDPLERTKNRVRNMIRNSFERKGMAKSKKTEEIIGCSIETLIQELIRSYEQNYNKKWEWKYLPNVHIDHIEPLANANTEEEIVKLCNHKNLQLLTKLDNLSKWKN